VFSNPGVRSDFIAQPRFGVALSLVVALGVVLTFMLWPKPVPLSNVRVHNASAYTLSEVTLGRGRYGNIRPGETTSYIGWGPAYSHEYAAFVSGGKPHAQMPEDHFNEKPLGPGNYTYTIDFGGSSDSTAFILELSKD
jgi:hypothetical protein